MPNDVFSRIIAAEEAKKKALRGLHRELGYPSAQALAEAILGAAEASPSPPSKSAKAPKAPTARRGGGRGRRISEEVRSGIVAALEAGEPGNQLTAKFGVSYGVIHAIKTKLGLVKKHGSGDSGASKSKKTRKKRQSKKKAAAKSE